MNKKHKKTDKKIIIESVICCIIFLGAVVFVILWFKNLAGDKLKEMINIPLGKIEIVSEAFSQNTENSNTSDEASQPGPYSFDKDNEELFERYKNYNNDVCAYIRIPDTTVDLPVMRTLWDEEYYLRRDLDKKTNSYGVPFMDIDCKIDTVTDNIIIYGHNITKYERAVFADVSLYESEEYMRSNPYIYLITENGTRTYQIFAYTTINTSENDFFRYADYTNAEDGKYYEWFYSFVEDIRSNALVYLTDYIPEYGHGFLTLSTCANEQDVYHSHRMVIFAQLVY